MHAVDTDGGEWWVHHALWAWGVFAIAIVGTAMVKDLSTLNHIVATIALSVMIHGGTLYGMSDYQLVVNSGGHGPRRTLRNVYVSVFIAYILAQSFFASSSTESPTKSPTKFSTQRSRLAYSRLMF